VGTQSAYSSLTCACAIAGRLILLGRQRKHLAYIDFRGARAANLRMPLRDRSVPRPHMEIVSAAPGEAMIVSAKALPRKREEVCANKLVDVTLPRSKLRSRASSYFMRVLKAVPAL
jgi:hypothetical protein